MYSHRPLKFSCDHKIFGEIKKNNFKKKLKLDYFKFFYGLDLYNPSSFYDTKIKKLYKML